MVLLLFYGNEIKQLGCGVKNMRLQQPTLISTKKGTYTMKNKIYLLAGITLLGLGIYLSITFLGDEKKADAAR